MLKLKLQNFGPLIQITISLENTLMPGRLKAKKERIAEDELVNGWHHPLNGHKFVQTMGDSEDKEI